MPSRLSERLQIRPRSILWYQRDCDELYFQSLLRHFAAAPRFGECKLRMPLYLNCERRFGSKSLQLERRSLPRRGANRDVMKRPEQGGGGNER